MNARTATVKEKRSAPRVQEKFPVKINTGETTLKGMSCDVSTSGLACTSSAALPLSASVQVNLVLPRSVGSSGERDIICKAQVVRVESRPNGIGRKDYRLAFNFDRMSKSDRRKLEHFIARKLANLPGGIVTAPADISQNGITCNSDTFIPPFREVQINVIFPGVSESDPPLQTIRCSGVVVNCDKIGKSNQYRIDLFFTDIAKKDKTLLRRYLTTVH